MIVILSVVDAAFIRVEGFIAPSNHVFAPPAP